VAARRDRSGSLIRLLNLPAEADVLAALEEAMPQWTIEEAKRSLSEAGTGPGHPCHAVQALRNAWCADE
jgi:hypothetical protein